MAANHGGEDTLKLSFFEGVTISKTSFRGIHVRWCRCILHVVESKYNLCMEKW